MPLTTINYQVATPPTENDLRVLDVLAGIITNGIESGYVDYWARVSDYQWRDSDDPNWLSEGRTFTATATIREHNESDDSSEWGEPFDLTPETMLEGVIKVITETRYPNSDIPALGSRLLQMLKNPSDHDDFDAQDADILIQYALLGDVVYS